MLFRSGLQDGTEVVKETPFSVKLDKKGKPVMRKGKIAGGAKAGRVELFREMSDFRLLIVGFGSIGRAIAQRAKVFETKILAVKKHLSTELFADHVYTQEELMDVLPKADIVIAALPSTPDTENFFGADQFAAMKKTALFINIARASIVDENALIDALEKGSIAGACLDVFSKEPLPADHPFWKMKNVIMTPHTASMVPDFWNKLTALLQTNFVNFSRGEKLMNEMDKKKGY